MANDGNRVNPINYLIIHHSAGPAFSEGSDREVADWYSSVGKGRGYKNYAHSYHYDPRTGKETFAQAHYALHRYSGDKNKYGWRLVLLIRDPELNVSWGAGNWPVNQHGINIEICGDYSYKTIDPKALLLITDSFIYLDKRLGGNLLIRGHKEVSQTGTACPGKIQTQMPILKDMFNNRSKYENLLVPPVVVPPPPPVPPVKTDAEKLKELQDIFDAYKNEKELIISDLEGKFASAKIVLGFTGDDVEFIDFLKSVKLKVDAYDKWTGWAKQLGNGILAIISNIKNRKNGTK